MKVKLDPRCVDVAREIKLVLVNRFADKTDAVHLMVNCTQYLWLAKVNCKLKLGQVLHSGIATRAFSSNGCTGCNQESSGDLFNVLRLPLGNAIHPTKIPVNFWLCLTGGVGFLFNLRSQSRFQASSRSFDGIPQYSVGQLSESNCLHSYSTRCVKGPGNSQIKVPVHYDQNFLLHGSFRVKQALSIFIRIAISKTRDAVKSSAAINNGHFSSLLLLLCMRVWFSPPESNGSFWRGEVHPSSDSESSDFSESGTILYIPPGNNRNRCSPRNDRSSL